MEQSLLYATHLALNKLLWEHSIWSIYACTPKNGFTLPDKWKVKTRKYNESTGSYSTDSLKYVDCKTSKTHVISFNFGFIKQYHIQGIGKPGILLQHEYGLEREIVERMCQLSDAGHTIVSNGKTILDKFKGSEFLIGIDMEAPSYSHLDTPIAVPF